MKVVLLNGGGKDTLAVAIKLQGQYEFHSLYVDANPNAREAECAAKIAAKYCVSHKTITIGGGPFLVTTPNSNRPFVHLPFKNAVLWSLGAMYAADIGAEAVASGARADVMTEDFRERIKLLYTMTEKLRPAPLVIAPLSNNVEEVYDLIHNDPLWHETAYCQNSDPPCNSCYGCNLREKWEAR